MPTAMLRTIPMSETPRAPTRRAIAVSVAVLSFAVSGCVERAPLVRERPVASPQRPSGATVVRVGESLQARIDAATAGSCLALEPGAHLGPIRIDKRLCLWGSSDAVVRSTGVGSTVDVTAAGVELLGFRVDGSGARFDLTDAAVRVRADDVRVVGLTVERALFGILVEKAHRVTVTGNRVHGNGEPSLGLRGDAIRLWEVRDSTVAENHVLDSRDVVVWYSSGNQIRANLVERCRYGTHFMYSHDNVVEQNDYLANVVGIFVMYSRGVALRENLIALSSGAAGLGLGLKESGQMEVTGNRFVRNATGIHSDNSPLNRDDHNTFERNLFSGSDTAVAFNGIAERSTFRGNVFRSNNLQVRVDGGDSAANITWEGNDFDDYRGYDFDGDGVGDVPYELRRLSTDLTVRFPDLAFFHGTPALALIDVSSHVMPLFHPDTILVDPSPSMRGLEGGFRAR